MANNLPARLRALRKSLGFTQTALAGRVGITQAYLAELEKGSKRPSIDLLEKLCDALSCSADYLLGLSSSRSYKPLGKEGPSSQELTPEILHILTERNITGRELELALNFVKTMQDENAKK